MPTGTGTLGELTPNEDLDAVRGVNLNRDQLPQMQPRPSSSAVRQTQRDRRLGELLDNCRTEVIQQIIGPFGLTPAMFTDIDGGNVTTQHNAEKDIYAKNSEHYRRKKEYKYDKAKSKKMKEAYDSGEMDTQFFYDNYTGKQEPTKRTTAAGKTVMNAELDHTIPLKQAHQKGGWMLDPKRRGDLASEKGNLNYTTHANNRIKSDTEAEIALSAQSGYDEGRTGPIIAAAQEAIGKHLPTTGERLKYHGRELGITGATEFGKAALRRAFGVLLFEFVNGSLVEMRTELTLRQSDETLLNRMVALIQRVAGRVQGKFKEALREFFRGGLQGFISNLLTFLINNLVTTAAKVVAIIREGLSKLWDALKILLWPPEGMTTPEVMRAVTKSIAGLFTLGAGMLWEQSINAFIVSIPVLAPIAGLIAPVLTGLMTGLATALLMYGIDSILGWMLDKGTALLNARVDTLQAQEELIASVASHMDAQSQLNAGYRQMLGSYQQIECHFDAAHDSIAIASAHAQATTEEQKNTIDAINNAIDVRQRLNERLNSLLNK